MAGLGRGTPKTYLQEHNTAGVVGRARRGRRDRRLMWAIRRNAADLNTERRTTPAELDEANVELDRAYLRGRHGKQVD